MGAVEWPVSPPSHGICGAPRAHRAREPLHPPGGKQRDGGPRYRGPGSSRGTAARWACPPGPSPTPWRGAEEGLWYSSAVALSAGAPCFWRRPAPLPAGRLWSGRARARPGNTPPSSSQGARLAAEAARQPRAYSSGWAFSLRGPRHRNSCSGHSYGRFAGGRPLKAPRRRVAATRACRHSADASRARKLGDAEWATAASTSSTSGSDEVQSAEWRKWRAHSVQHPANGLAVSVARQRCGRDGRETPGSGSWPGGLPLGGPVIDCIEEGIAFGNISVENGGENCWDQGTTRRKAHQAHTVLLP